MSCACSTCNCNPCSCSCTETPDPANEALTSQLNNFITTFYGTVTKTVVDGQIVWELPCELETGIDGFPRLDGESVACYFMRYFASFVSATQGPVGPEGPQGPTGATGPQGPAGDPLAPGTGYTGTFNVVLNTAFSSPNLLQQKMNLVYVNGILVSVGTPYNEVVTTAVDCP